MTATVPPETPLPDSLAHLLDRAERGVILPAEARQLRAAVTELHQDLVDERAYSTELRGVGHDIAVYAGLIPPARIRTALPAPDTEEPSR